MSPDIHKEYVTPPSGQAVTRFDHCPCFSGRQSLLAIDPICWFCKFAAFDMFSDKLPDCGICRYPESTPSDPCSENHPEPFSGSCGDHMNRKHF